MVRDEDRALARILAERFHGYHAANGHPDYQIGDKFDGVETHRRGLLGEFAFKNEFGGAVDGTLRAGGDEQDFALRLCFTFKVDVKTISYNGPDPLLAVPIDDLEPLTIYIAGRYDPLADDVDLFGWEWGRTLAREGSTRRFVTSGPLNYVLPFARLRSLGELHARLIGVV